MKNYEISINLRIFYGVLPEIGRSQLVLKEFNSLLDFFLMKIFEKLYFYLIINAFLPANACINNFWSSSVTSISIPVQKLCAFEK